jgi:hypothetical protein
MEEREKYARITLRWVLERQVVMMRHGQTWLRIMPNGGFWYKRFWASGFSTIVSYITAPSLSSFPCILSSSLFALSFPSLRFEHWPQLQLLKLSSFRKFS